MTTADDIRAMFPEIEIEVIREKYGFERDRRARTDASNLYRRPTGELAEFAVDPNMPFVERDSVRDEVEVTVLGGGLSGVAAAVRLKKAGIESVRNVDEAGDFGGVWYWNRYPGVRCDIEAHVYMLMLEETGFMPTQRYATGDEILGQIQAVAKKYELHANALFHTQVTRISWDDGRWLVETNRGDAYHSKNIIVAIGPTATLKLPAIPGIEDFKGKLFHSSRWDYAYTGGDQHGGLTGLEGKRVAVIGTGATGIQIIPEVAKYAEHLYVMQRTPANVDVRGNQPTGPDWVGSTEPGWQDRRMENFLLNMTGADVEVDHIQDGWTRNRVLMRRHNTGEFVSEFTGEERELYEEYLDARVMNANRARVDEIVQDPAVAELLKPWYRWACKRPNFSDFYLQTFNRENVTLVDTADFGGVTKMTEHSIWVGDTEYEVDLVVVATGFELGLSGVLSGALPVIGRKGRNIHEAWAASGGIRLFHGYTTHEFPNFFQLGPSLSVNSINFAHILQMHGEHVAEMIRLAKEAGKDYIEPSEAQQDSWFSEILQNNRKDQKAYHEQCTPGAYNGEGQPREDMQYGPGPIVFREMLAQWRTNSIHEVLHEANDLLEEDHSTVVVGA